MKKPVYKRIWFYIVAVILLAVVGVALSLPFSYGVQSLIIKVTCNDKSPSIPENYDEVLNETQVLARDLSYGSAYENGVLDIIAPKSAEGKLPLVVYLHGGYYAGGDKLSKEPYCRVVSRLGYIVANVNYALTPKEKYPVQVCQANEAISFLIKNADTYHIDADKVFIGGDSAGGHLSGMMGAYYTNDALAKKIGFERALTPSRLKGVILLCGFYNTDTVNDNYFFLLPSAMWMLTGEKDFLSYDRIDELCTVKNVTESYPATYITCGDKDPFYSQNEEMVGKLEEKGVTVSAYLPKTTDKALKHEFQCDFSLPECKTAMEQLSDFLAKNQD